MLAYKKNEGVKVFYFLGGEVVYTIEYLKRRCFYETKNNDNIIKI